MELANYITALDNNTSDTLNLAKKCSNTQLHYSAEGKWSILQILEHICIVDKVCIAIISRPASENTSALTEIYGNEKLKDALVTNRDRRIESPEILKPKGGVTDVNEFEKMFLYQRNMLKQNLTSGKIIVDNKIHKHPFLGDMTIADWLYFIVHHTQRHTEQIKEKCV
ncbi:DinB family protein [Flavobacterium petrolei]|uniref:DinB family protein n=1 Tax=Flavobacterium petrolei TaxID=2259594 RepID=A0A482TX11_9FLAO|nr:DinB family protein [Flavobacterium petrolei]RYJ51090.1 DinB family protein [Flavobacterium petrolei]